jgi:hypothetical protein
MRRWLTFFCFCLLAATQAHGTVPAGEWVTTGTPTGTGSIVTLADGTALLMGPRVERYDPDTGAWLPAGTLQGGQVPAEATLLPSGLVLVTGGGTNAAQVYDPATGTSTFVAPMHVARSLYRATLLASGKVLVSGGITPGSGPIATAEIFDPLTQQWSVTGALNVPRALHGAARLPNGSVLVTGGSGDDSAETYDPVAGAWAFTSPLGQPLFDTAAVTLGDGRVLVVGNRPDPSNAFFNLVDSRLYDPVKATWAPSNVVAPLSQSEPNGLLIGSLRDGTPLVVFGSCSLELITRSCKAGAALFDVPSGVWMPTPPVSFDAPGDGPAVLGDGRAILTPSALFRPDNSTPRLVVDPLAVELTVPAPGAANQASLTVRNTGGATLRGTVTAAAPFSVVSGSPFTLPPGGSATVVVQFAPSTPGFASGVIQFTSNGNWESVTATGVVADDVVNFVSDFYLDALGRAPDLSELQGWSGFLAQHCTLGGVAVVADAFFDSPEFRARPLTLTGLVTALYRAMLGRDPDPSGLTGWVGVFRQARSALAIGGIISSGEFRQLLPDRGDRQAVTLLVQRLYTEILGRTPDSSDVTPWVDYIVATADVEGAAVAFLGSGEFELRALTFREYVAILYRGFLGRPPDAGGLDGWEQFLRAQLLAVLNDGFIPSAEFQARVSRICRS